MQRPLASSSEMKAAAEWKSADSSASRSHSRVGAIRASSSTSSDVTAELLELEQASLDADARGPVAADAGRPHHSVAGHEEHEAVLGTEASDGARRSRVPGERSELSVAHDLATRQRAQALCDGALKRRRPVEVERDIRERDVVASENEVRRPTSSDRFFALESSCESAPNRNSCASTTPSAVQSSPTPHPGTA